MKWHVLPILLVVAAGGCAAPEHRYAGSPGSVYDAARDPPVVIPKDGYDPMKAVPEHDYGNGGSPAPATPSAR